MQKRWRPIVRRGFLFLTPSAVIFAIALLASIGVHLPVYEVLGVLVKAMAEREAAAARNQYVTFELTDRKANSKAKPDDKTAVKPEKSAVKLAEKVLENRESPKVEHRPKTETAPKIKPPLIRVTEAPPQSVIPQQPEVENKLAVKQKSDDPTAAPPDHSRFIAEENRRVEEETVATSRNMQRDDERPTPRLGPGPNTGEQGSQEESESADLEDRKGSDERTATRREAELKTFSPSEQPSAGSRESIAAVRAPRPGASALSREARPRVEAGAPEAGGQEQMQVIDDGIGTFRVPRVTQGRGPGKEPGEYREGAQAQKRGNDPGATASQKGTNLKLSWSQFEDTFGANQLQQQREAYLRQKHSGTRGSGEKRWQEFRAAIENFVTDVKPGDQTALNAAASPFAEYLSEVHRRIHREFAYRFIANLPMVSGPFSDPSLFTELEIVFNRDGSVHRIGVIKSSGFIPFDYGTFEAVMRGQPYPEAPQQILSGDGRVYVHWGFYRNARLCGTFNVKPFILPHPPGMPQPDQQPFQDPGG
jgi:hypothetical protein